MPKTHWAFQLMHNLGIAIHEEFWNGLVAFDEYLVEAISQGRVPLPIIEAGDSFGLARLLDAMQIVLDTRRHVVIYQMASVTQISIFFRRHQHHPSRIEEIHRLDALLTEAIAINRCRRSSTLRQEGGKEIGKATIFHKYNRPACAPFFQNVDELVPLLVLASLVECLRNHFVRFRFQNLQK